MEADSSYVATAFLWNESTAITNFHVAKDLCDDLPKTLPAPANGATLAFENRSSNPCDPAKETDLEGPTYVIESCVEVDIVHDIAILKLASAAAAELGISKLATLDHTVSEGDAVAIVGYPRYAGGYFEDPTEYEPDTLDRFRRTYRGNTFDLRVSPGRVYSPPTGHTWFGHDATTYPGHSGSIVFSLENAKVVGIHHTGKPSDKMRSDGYKTKRRNFLTAFKDLQNTPIGKLLKQPTS